jgi:RNA polymerase sigma-70 factor (ECF subfamily)
MATQTKAPEQSGLDREQLADLLERVASHADRDAFAGLYRHFAPRVKAYLLRQGADNGQAEELAQEVMLTVWRKAASFDRTQASVSTWLFTVARNRRIDALRRERPIEFDPADPLLVPAEPERPDDALSQVQREERLQAAVRDLPSEQADLLQLAFFAGRSHREIADETGLPLGTVKSRLRLAFGRLRRALEESDEGSFDDI